MGVVINFEERKSSRQPVALVEPVWSKHNNRSEVDAFHDYVQSSENWFSDGYWETIYEGYPFMPPSAPPHPDAVWYVGGHDQHFGVWLLNKSSLPVEKVDGHFGWNPLVRKSVAPPFEPLNISDLSKRRHVSWIVSEDGYGQYGLLLENGDEWVPAPRPQAWVDPSLCR